MTPLQYLPVATLLLAATSAAGLSGENLCHKRETYTVTMRVLVKEPVHVKTYTWCLQVPPRCTKYKIEMRDRYKIQTEIRERVVDVCCAGYAPDRSQTLCIPVCRGCLHGVCGTPDTCYCEPGYIGDRCDTECQNGFWGSACVEECQCQNGATCNHVTGDCKCADGWRGILCDVPCPRGTYGHACMKECECPASNNNGGNITCDHVTGKCTSSQEVFPVNSDDNTLPGILLTTALPMLNPITTNEASKSASDMEAIGSQNDSNSRPIGNEDGNNRSRSEEHVTDTTAKSNVQVDSGTTIPSESTRVSISPTDSFPLPSTEKHISSIDDKLTTRTPPIHTTPLIINTTVPTTTLSTIITTVPTTLQPIMTEENESWQTPSGIDNSVMNDPSLKENNNESNGVVNEIINTGNKSNSQEHREEVEVKEDDNDGGDDDDDDDDDDDNDDDDDDDDYNIDNMFETVKTEQTTEQITTEPQNIQLPPHGIIVVSDGLMSERTEGDDGKDFKSGVWNLVSSVSVAGGVALALIVMAAVTLVVSHRRNRLKIAAAENKAENFKRQQLEQEQQPQQITCPQMYTYTEDDVSPSPLRNLFPDAAYQLNADRPRPEGLQLHFGDVTNTAVTNNNLGPPYHDMRAYLELQYDIPPSSISSKSNSLLPGMEPEHLYDEIPCWRSNTTTSTNTDTDTSPC